jgi:hypothetical protein
MAWIAALYLPTPSELLAKLPKDAPREFRVIEGRSDGNGAPAYVNGDTGEPMAADDVRLQQLQAAWESYGPTGTGCVGQVRDMLWTMATVAAEGGYRLDVPPETAEKAQEEARADDEAWGEGGVR